MTEDEYLAAQTAAAEALYATYSPTRDLVDWSFLNQTTKDGWYERALVALVAAGIHPDKEGVFTVKLHFSEIFLRDAKRQLVLGVAADMIESQIIREGIWSE